MEVIIATHKESGEIAILGLKNRVFIDDEADEMLPQLQDEDYTYQVACVDCIGTFLKSTG